MGQTQFGPKQLGSKAVDRNDMDTATTGIAVITKVIAGSQVNISQTGVDAGTGDVTINLNDMSSENLSPSSSQTISAGFGLVVPRKFTLNTSVVLTLKSGAILRIV